MLENYLVQTCKIYTLSRNEYGDFVAASYVTEDCRFREISVVRRTPHQEVSDSDAMLWLHATTTAQKGSIVEVDGVKYQVERFIRARKLDNATVNFVKCELNRYEI